MLGKEYLALFDLDGTLFNTTDVNYFSYKKALEMYGVLLDKKYFLSKCIGRHYMEFLPILMGSAEHAEDVHCIKKKIYSSNLNMAKMNRHLFQIIEGIRDKYYIAVVTTASKMNTIEILEYFECMYLFDYIVTQEDVCKRKPDPQGFVMAMNHFGIDAEHTIIFEDSDIGVKAARAVGAAVIIVDTM